MGLGADKEMFFFKFTIHSLLLHTKKNHLCEIALVTASAVSSTISSVCGDVLPECSKTKTWSAAKIFPPQS